MRLAVVAFVVSSLAGCGSATSNAGPPPAEEVATPTEIAQAPAQAPTQAPPQAVSPPASFPQTCVAIAKDIAALAGTYPQLASFHAGDSCAIFYDHKTHKPTTRGGWSSAVPHPDPDGVWFYIGIYDPNGPEANSQIHTQPMVPNWWIGSHKVMFLILEGEKTKPVAGALMKVLERHGLETR